MSTAFSFLFQVPVFARITNSVVLCPMVVSSPVSLLHSPSAFFLSKKLLFGRERCKLLHSQPLTTSILLLSLLLVWPDEAEHVAVVTLACMEKNPQAYIYFEVLKSILGYVKRAESKNGIGFA